jgi:hypothetical protein
MIPKMLIEHKSGECITIVRCSECRSLIYGPFLLKSADVYNEKMRALLEAHVSQVHTG